MWESDGTVSALGSDHGPGAEEEQMELKHHVPLNATQSMECWKYLHRSAASCRS